MDNVLILSNYKSPYGGNFVASLICLSKDIKLKYGIDCVLVFPKEATEKEWYSKVSHMGIPVDVFDFTTSVKQFNNSLRLLSEKYNAGVVHTHFSSMLNTEIYALNNRKQRVFIHIHSDFSAGKSSLKDKLVNMFVYRFLSSKVRFLSVSKSFVKMNPRRVAWIPNALATERIPCEHIDGNVVKKELLIPKDAVVCEIFAWSPYIKGVDIAVNAIKKINEKTNLKVYLMIVCGIKYSVESMPEYIKDNTDCFGNEDYLIYASPTEDVYRYHEAADILLSSSRSEGFSYAVLEMLCNGKKCVISDIEALDWAKEYEGTYFFKSEDVDDCVNAIIKAVYDKPNINMEKVKDKYAIKRWTTEIERQYFG